MSNKSNDCVLDAITNAGNITSFKVKFSNDNNFTGDNSLKKVNKIETSHVSVYLGADSRSEKTPFIKITTGGCDYAVIPPTTSRIADKADRQVSIALYPSPKSNCSVMKSRIILISD